MNTPKFDVEAAKGAEGVSPLAASTAPDELVYAHRARFRDGQVGSLLKTVCSQPFTRERFLQLLNDADTLGIDDPDIPIEVQRMIPTLTAFLRDSSLRPLLVEAMMEDLREDSQGVLNDILGAQPILESDPTNPSVLQNAAFDVVVVGGGIHASILVNELLAKRPDLKVLIVESSDSISNNFRHLGEFTRLNSQNRHHESDPVPDTSLGRPNLNTFGVNAPVQVPYFEPNVYPSASSLADAATLNVFSSGVNTLLEQEVTEIKDAPEGALQRHRIVLSNGASILAGTVIVTTGLGESTLPKQFDALSREICEREIAKCVGTQISAIVTYPMLSRCCCDLDFPFRPFIGENIVVSGAGDSGNTIVEWLMRLAPAKSYGDDVAQHGDVKSVRWCGSRVKTQAEYLDSEPGRYSDVGAFMPKTEDDHSRVRPFDGYLVEVRDSDNPELGRFKVGLLSRSGVPASEYCDRIILATGFRNTVGDLFNRDTNPFDDDEICTPITIQIETTPVPLTVAEKLSFGEIYAVGPATGSLFSDEELQQAGYPTGTRGVISISMFGPRTEAFAAVLAERAQNSTLPRSRKDEIAVLEIGSAESPIRVLPQVESEDVRITTSSEIELRMRLGKLLEHIISDAGDLSIKFSWCREAGSIELSSDNPLSDQGLDILVKRIEKDERLLAFLNFYLSRGRWDLEVTVPVDQSGFPKISQMVLASASRTHHHHEEGESRSSI